MSDGPILECLDPTCSWTTRIGNHPALAKGRRTAHVRSKHPTLGLDDPSPVEEPTAPIVPDAVLGPTVDPTVKPAGGIIGKIKGKLGGPARPSRSTGETRPDTGKKRASLDQIGEWVWSGLATMIANSGYVSMPRVMALESPVIGSIVEDSLKGTMVDRVLQPVARMGKGGEELAAAFIMPIAVGAAERNPQFYGQARAMLRWSMIALMPRIKNQMRKEIKEQRDLDELFADLGPQLGLDRPATFDDVCDWVFAASPAEPPAAPGEPANGSGPPAQLHVIET